MKYRVFFDQAVKPCTIQANGIVHAQQVADATLKDMQREGKMLGWTIKTVVEANV